MVGRVFCNLAQLVLTVSDRVEGKAYPFCEPPHFRDLRTWRLGRIRWHHIIMAIFLSFERQESANNSEFY